ncbi:MAG: hypothetical protein II344_02050 [Bacteroidales bacterium]|nr:hypothetical protein [Bacteroidales bacterium]
MNKKYSSILLIVFLCICSIANAQITMSNFVAGPPGTTQEQQTQEEEIPQSKKVPSFTIKRYFKALAHTDSMKIGHMAAGAVILPGTAQIYNKHYWKLPIVYGGIGGCIAGAAVTDNKNLKTGLIVGAAAFYWGSIFDGVVSYKSTTKPLPARATLYSILLPGLGQAYNGDYWKIPIFYAGLTVSGYCWGFNQQQYNRYRKMYKEWGEGTYNGPLTPDNIKYYRDQYRRFRDYSILATALVYLLNVIDANVFAHFNNFDVSDDITFNVEPAIIENISPTATSQNGVNQYFGMSMNLKF